MLDVSKTTSLLQSLGVNASTANQAAQRTVQAANTYALSFLQELHDALQAVSGNATSVSTPTSTSTPANAGASVTLSTVDLDRSTATQGTTTTTDTTAQAPSSDAKPPFDNLEEFREWEKGLGKAPLAPGYQAPDYLRFISLAMQGGDQDAFKRYVFFKNNPQYAQDYEAIRNGQLSKFPTDGSTVIRTDLSKLPTDVADYYRKNPAALRAAEGFSMDPTLYKMQMDGTLERNSDPSWLMTHQWTPNGIVERDHSAGSNPRFIGLDGKGADNYKLATYENGLLVDIDGRRYDPVTGTEQV